MTGMGQTSPLVSAVPDDGEAPIPFVELPVN